MRHCGFATQDVMRRQAPDKWPDVPTPTIIFADESAPPPSPPSSCGASSPVETTDHRAGSTALAKRSTKSNSERGKEFRAKRKEYERKLLEAVGSLRQEVTDLRLLRGIRHESALRMRHSLQGSLVRLVEEYFRLFENGTSLGRGVGAKRGSSQSEAQLLARQVAFVRRAMEEGLKFGEISGVDALLDQWRRYTAYHSRFRVSIVSVDVSGTEDDPVVTVTSDLRVTFSRATFEHIFPHVANDDEFVRNHIGREVVYRGVNQFRFTSEGRICMYESDVGFVDALLTAGMSLVDVARLMRRALIANQYLLGNDPASPRVRIEVLEEEEEEADWCGEDAVVDAWAQHHPRLDRTGRHGIEYLLS